MAVFGLLDGLAGWLGDALGGGRAKLTEPDARRAVELTSIGPPVSPDAAMRIATVWACVRLLSETIGTLPLGVYLRGSDGKRREVPGHAVADLVGDSPNADQTAPEFWEAVVACLCLWGNFYAEKTKADDGRVQALTPWRPDRVTVRRAANGARLYRYVDPLGGDRELSEDDVFHVRGFGIGGDLGLSPIGYARRTLGVAIAADEAASNAVRNGVRPAGFIITGQKTLSPEQRADIRSAVLDPITGPNGHARAGVLEAGFDWKDATGLPPEDLQLLQTRSFHIEEVCRWFRVPPFMVGHTDKSTSWGTGLEQQMLGFLTFALRPYLVRIEKAVRSQLCTVRDRARGVYAEFALEGLMRADSQGRAALYASAAQNGWMTRNEIRALENLPPVDGGDVATVQVNLADLSKIGSAASDPALAAAGALKSWLGLDALFSPREG